MNVCDVQYFPTLLIVLLAVFNDGAMIALSKDRVVASRTPNVWTLPSIFITGEISLPLTSALCISIPCAIVQLY